MKRRHNGAQASFSEAKRAPIADNSDTIKERIISGQLSCAQSCDGKTRFTSYDFADRVGQAKGKEYRKEYRTYACPFCGGWHLASVTRVAS